jgi:hypothetical protein
MLSASKSMRSACCALAVMLRAAIPASAQPSRDAQTEVDQLAKRHFERGTRLLDARRFAEASDEFATGYELSHRAVFLFDMAECQRLLHRGAQAKALYQRYLATGASDELADTARARLIELDAIETVSAAPPTADASGASSAAATAATTAPAPGVTPAPTAPAPQPDLRPAVVVTARDAAPVIAASPALRSEPVQRPLWRRPAFWIVAGTAMVAGSVGIYMMTRGQDSCSGARCVDLR